MALRANHSIRRWILTLAMFSVLLFSAVSAAAQTPPPPGRTWTSWVGPFPFLFDAAGNELGLRPSFHGLWDSPQDWDEIRSQMEVYKTYQTFLPKATHDELVALKQVLGTKEVAFEVGGLRPGPAGYCSPTLGKDGWDSEYNISLKRWLDAGGHIDYLTTDHALMYTYFGIDPSGQSFCHGWTREQLVEQLAIYFSEARKTLGPSVKFGIIESLGMWKIGDYYPCGWSPDPLVHPNAHECVYEIVELSAFLDQVVQKASQTDPPVTIDHFHVDFGYDGVSTDQPIEGGAGRVLVDGVDFGRILGAENAVRAHNMKVGIIANAYDLPGAPDPNISARDRTTGFLKAYFKTTAAPDTMIFQQWQPYPDTLGTEDDSTATTSLGLIHTSLLDWGTPASLPDGEYIVPPFSTIIKVTGGTYCVWENWNNYMTAHGNNGDLSELAGYGARPRNQTYSGGCPGATPAAPTLTSISPTSGLQGQVLTVSLSGSNFVGGTAVNPPGGVTAGNTNIANGSALTSKLTIASNTTPGTYTVRVTTAGGTSNTVNFTVQTPAAPTLSTVSPASGTRGQSFTATFSGTNFVAGGTSLNLPSGVTASNVNVSNATSLTATLTVSTSATAGTFNISVTTAGGTSNTRSFTVQASGTPTLSSISPAAGIQGHTVSLTLTGTNFVPGGTTLSVPTGYATVSNVSATYSTLTATLTIAANAAIGAFHLGVFTAVGYSNDVTFTINPPAPTLTAVSPAIGTYGQTLTVAFTGTNFITNTLNGGTNIITPSGITASNVNLASSTLITAVLTIATTTAPGTYNLAVYTVSGASGNVTFTVLPPPTLSSVSPTGAFPNQGLTITFSGTNFLPGATTVITPAGITAVNVQVTSTSSMTAWLTVASNATVGAKELKVATASGNSNAVTFNVLSDTQAPTTPTGIDVQCGWLDENTPACQGTWTASSDGNGSGVVGYKVNVIGSFGTLRVQPDGTWGSNDVITTTTNSALWYWGDNFTSVAVYAVDLVGNVSAAGTWPPPPPTLSAINPTSGVRGQTVTVTFTGTSFIPGNTTLTSVSGITINSVNVVSSTSLTASFCISSSATLGNRAISVSTPWGTSSAVNFSVQVPPPTLSSISPASGLKGMSVPVTLTGTNFVTGGTTLNVPTGITVSSMNIPNASTITATLNISTSISTGNYNITISTAYGTTGAVTFNVLPQDTQAPTTPTNVSVECGWIDEYTAACQSTWSASTDSGGSGMQGYRVDAVGSFGTLRVYPDGNLGYDNVITTSGTSMLWYYPEGLTGIRVYAVDNAGNVSAAGTFNF